MAHHTPAMHAAMPSTADTVAASAAQGGNGLVMTLAHCVAALVAAWWLRRGERAAWAMVRWVAAAADRPVRLLPYLLTIEAAVPPRPVPVVPAADTHGHRPGAAAPGRPAGSPPRSRALAHF